MQKARFLNKEKVVEMPSKLATKAKAKDKNIKRVILFGSLANNTYTSLSDADLLIILKRSDVRFIDSPVPVDVFPYTEDEIERVAPAKKAISKGIVLGKQHIRPKSTI